MQIVFVPCRGGASEVGFITDTCVQFVDFQEEFGII